MYITILSFISHIFFYPQVIYYSFSGGYENKYPNYYFYKFIELVVGNISEGLFDVKI